MELKLDDNLMKKLKSLHKELEKEVGNKIEKINIKTLKEEEKMELINKLRIMKELQKSSLFDNIIN